MTTTCLSAKVDENWEKLRSSSPGSLCRPEYHRSSGSNSRIREGKRQRSNLLVCSIRDIHYENVLREDDCHRDRRSLAGSDRERHSQSFNKRGSVKYQIYN